jgi:hypothetical protein
MDGRSAPVNGLETQPSRSVAILLLTNFQRLLGRSLVPAGIGEAEAPVWLYEAAPFCVLAHDVAPDPRFIYANKTAQRCFEYGWAVFTTLPSRLSAEAPNRAERQRLLDKVSRDGFATGYSGMRISGSGRRFRIEDGTVWQLTDDRGALRGQAAMFPRWKDVEPSSD